MVEKYLAGLGINDGTKDTSFVIEVVRQVKFTPLIRRLVNIKNKLYIRSDI
jgi:hypothetical protein